MIDRKHFFDTVRESLFNGAMSQGQVHGMEAILREWEEQGLLHYEGGKLTILDLPRVQQERDRRIDASRAG